METAAFKELCERLAMAWSRQDTETALSCFTEDAVYMEPPDLQLFRGHEELRPYFAALTPGTVMRFENLWFDEERQIGAGEYTFGEEGEAVFDHGVTVMEIRDGLIAAWREYQRKGPPTLEAFTEVAGKSWEWHAGKYA